MREELVVKKHVWQQEECLLVKIKLILIISMCNQMVMSEIREEFHGRFVQILIISRAFMGDELR